MGSFDATCSVPCGMMEACSSEASVRIENGKDLCNNERAGPIPIVCRFDSEVIVPQQIEGYAEDGGNHEREVRIIETDDCEYLRDILSEEQISHARELAVRLCRSEYGPVDHFINYLTADPLERRAVQTIITHCRTVMEMETAVRIHEVFSDSEPGFIIRCHGCDCDVCRQFEGREYRLRDHDLRGPPFCLGCRCRMSMIPLSKMA